MENKKLLPFSVDEIQLNDTVFLTDDPDSTPYLVLDKGTPFILIENKETHFANLYRVTFNLYKYV